MSKHNNIWAFGYGYGLDFSNGNPVSFLSNISDERCAATACDENGQLLFYTNGDTVWNKNGEIMPGSQTALLPNPFSTDGGTRTGYIQGALIVPVVGNADQYYIFSMESLALILDEAINPVGSTLYTHSQRLFYSIVDMTLDNGKGDIVANKKGILLDSLLGAPLIAAPGNGCNIWLITHDMNIPQFRSYEISGSGINELPVISNSGNINAELMDSVAFRINWVYTMASMKMSPDNRKLALCSYNYFNNSGQNDLGLEIHDFDPATGILSNSITLDSVIGYTAACFSPDNSKLYANRGAGLADPAYVGAIDQYDLSQPTLTDIVNSRVVLLDSAMANSDMKIGPDGKIYTNAVRIDSICRIDYPNLPGTACNFVPNVMSLLHNNVPAFVGPYVSTLLFPRINTMPNDLVFPVPDTTGTRRDTTLYKPAVITLKAPSGYRDYKWSNGSTDSVMQVSATGTYWVGYRTAGRCEYKMDTTAIKMKLSTGEAIAEGTVGMTVYPNPVRSSVNVTISGLQKIKGTLVIANAIGRAVLTIPFVNATQAIDISRLAEGVYIVQYISEDKMVQQYKTLVVSK